MEHGVLVLQDVVWELKQEHVLALLAIPVVHHVKVLQLKPDLAEWQQLTPDGEPMDHGVLVLQDVVWELKQEHVLALLAIHAVHHVVVLQPKPDLAEWK